MLRHDLNIAALHPAAAAAGIGTPAALGKTAQASAVATTVVIVLTAGASIGDRVVVWTTGAASSEASSVTDSQGNTYTASGAYVVTANAQRLRSFSSVLTTALAIADTITVTFGN